MCGILAVFSNTNHYFSEAKLDVHLRAQTWRGPDYTGVWVDSQRRALLGHNRLTILDASSGANMPMSSACGRYALVYNGEIYNHEQLRVRFNLVCKTRSDSETLLELYVKLGTECLSYLEGMFAFVIYDKIENRFFAARDQLGIKPLFYSAANGQTTFGSEPAVLRDIVGGGVSDIAIAEWKAFRRPLAGRTFFDRVSELKPGHYYDSKRGEHPYWMPTEEDVGGDYEEFKEELVRSVTSHLINDFQTVSLLSGGLDSAVILGLSDIEKSYTVGLEGNNEFEGATDSAGVLGVDLVKVQITQDELEASWAELLSSRREPLSVPNEGLIYTVCKSMNAEEKVVLTGEGADELLFGYDRIFRWGSGLQSLSVAEFVNRYTYSSYDALSLDTLDYLADCMRDKKPIEFLEDFFIGVHLPGLLRRMDGASMCASKEARVPFVTTKLFNMLYREPIEKRHIDGLPKSYLRRLAKELGLEGALSRAKVGFSATVGQVSKADEYTRFQNFCLDNLGWR